jgi:signal transduction histidine kinase
MRTQLEVAHRLGEGSPVTADLEAEVSRMTALVEDLLVLARLDADSAPESPLETVPVGALVEDVVDRYALARVPVSRGVVAPLSVLGRYDELRRALGNLVDNAVRHASHAVRVEARAEGPHVVVVVSDDGAGVAVADRERVFERFTRLDEGRDRDAGGSGLGLAIVRELVRRSGGEVRLEEAPGGGLSAQVLLDTAPAPPGRVVGSPGDGRTQSRA